MQTIPIATREETKIPAGSYIAFHAENIAHKMPENIQEMFAQHLTSSGKERYPTLLYTPDGTTVQTIDDGEVVGTLATKKERNGNYLLLFRTSHPESETTILTTYVFETETVEECIALLDKCISELIVQNRLATWRSRAVALQERGVTREETKNIESLIAEAVHTGNTTEGLIAAEKVLREAVVNASAVLKAQTEAARETWKKVKEETRNGNQ